MDINKHIATLRGLLYLNNTIKTGSYTKTVEKTFTKQSNVSVAIHKLEKETGMKLFSNASHGVVPTEEGLAIDEYAQRLLALLYDVQNYSTKAHSISGKIKLWTTDGIGTCLIQHLVDFHHQYPDVNLDVICSNEMPNFSTREADIAIVYSKPKPSEPVIFNEFMIKFGLFASPEYISRYGIPKNLDDLKRNHYICDRKEYTAIWPEWKEIIDHSEHVVAQINSSNLLIQFNKEGLGIGVHPINYGKIEKDLIPIDIDLHLEHRCWLVSHYDAKKTEKIQILLNHIQQVMSRL